MSYSLRHTHMDHDGGTKDYDIYVIRMSSAAGDRCLMIRRWGKVGTNGQCKVKDFSTARGCDAYVLKIVDDKQGHGYHAKSDDLVSNAPFSSVYKSLPSHIAAAITPLHLRFMKVDDGFADENDPFETVGSEPQPAPAKDRVYPKHYGTW